MLDKKLYKNNLDLTEYAKLADWGNKNNCIVVDQGEYYELVEVPAHVPTVEELKNMLINAVQSFMDDTARTRGYDNIASACSYANDYEPNETFKKEGKVCVLWRSAVWSYCYEQLALFESGQRSVPTIEELIAELPVLNWGD